MSKSVPVYADHELIRCLLSSRTIGAAALCAGCNRRTIQRRMDDPAFVAALDAERAKLVAATTSELERLALAATGKLWSVLENDLTETKEQLRAVGLILAHAVKYRETSDLIQKVEDLTNAINEINRGK